MSQYNDQIGDLIWINFDNLGCRLECIVTEVDPGERRACRFKTVHDGPWGVLGLLKEGTDWVVVEWHRELAKINPIHFSDN